MERIQDYKYALDESSIVAITDQKGIILYVNNNFCKISKYSSDELIGSDHRIINSGYHSKAFMKEMWSTIASGKVWKGEIKNKTKSGEYYWVYTTIIPFLNEKNKPYKYVSIRSDITSRKQGEIILKKTLKQVTDYKYALDQSSIVVIIDQNGIITHANHNFCKISGYSKNELIGQDYLGINSEYLLNQLDHILATIRAGKVWKGELKNTAKDGSVYWVDSTLVPFLDAAGEPYQYVDIRSDITERKNGEAQIRESKEKAIRHAEVLKLKNEQMVDFCSIISHNLRAPLINIAMLIDHIEEEEESDPEDQKFLLSKMKPVVNHLLEVFNELVESIQIKQDLEVRSEQVHLQECVERILSAFETQINEFDAEVRIDFGDIYAVFFPLKYLESILTNLISNALKFRSSSRKPVIEIKFFKSDDHGIVLSVSDNGLGIDLDLHKNEIFKIRKTFHHHPDARGFGLFITKTQIEAMGGSIWVESEPDRGSTFFIQFKIKL
jgi:PAS domain S-box-containing protein